MTVIVYRDGVMAADTSGWLGRSKHCWSSKLCRVHDGTLYGTTGECSEGQRYFAWLRDTQENSEPLPRDVNGDSTFSIMRVGLDGIIGCLTPFGWGSFEAPYYALGGGNPVAWGALYAGADAQTAVRAAIEHSDAAFGDVAWISRSGF